MKIKCISNKKSSYDGQFHIEECKEYTTYALSVFDDTMCFCICDEVYDFYPLWYSSILFEITDNRLSRFWIGGCREEKNRILPFLSFPEWVKDPYFFEKLIEGDRNDPNAIIFRKYKELMDFEFPDPTISETAQIGDSEWLICPKCMDAWQSKNDKDALVKCPKCWTIFNNPRYKNEYPIITL